MSEFDLIRRFLQQATAQREDVVLGIGDDCALLDVPAGRQLAVSMDTLVEGRHFAPGADPVALGYKALAVNLSDLAAMGAEPAWATLALTLPGADTAWLESFMTGFGALAASHGLQLVGGDTTRGPLSITVQVHGFVDADAVLRRDAARPGDRVYASGTIGDAALALALGRQPGVEVPVELQLRLDRPTPRVALGRELAGRAHAAIDVSDGLVADLGHVCAASAVAATIELARIPVSATARGYLERFGWQPVLAGGDDYELLFCVPAEIEATLIGHCRALGHEISRIGLVEAGTGIVLVYPDGRMSREVPAGFDHFADA
ncbi:MAG: thiamine-phosphate kinase [Gammaproteobacteria bacterium]|nr:thiamine-phosphate kinase [Gammaproteobacteria bacterium]